MARTLNFIVCITVMTAGVVTSEDVPPEVSDECKKLGSCDEVPNYPTEEVASIIGQEAAGTVITDTRCPDLRRSMRVPEIFRRGPGPQEENVELCRFDDKTIFPKAAVDVEGVWHYVIQDETHRQGFKVEICKEEDSACSGIVVFPPGYEGRCRQMSMYLPMNVLINGAKTQKSLKISTCCNCIGKAV